MCIVLLPISLFLLMTSAPLLAEMNDGAAIHKVVTKVPASSQGELVFHYRLPGNSSISPIKQVLFLVPGVNGDGTTFLNETVWTQFADRHNLLLIGPSFLSNQEEIQSRKGYYHPELWSGQATLDAVTQIELQAGIKIEKLYIFGFSGGAHFTHRFANWQPDKVAAFVAYSAGWWDAPVPGLRQVPALIMCGEKDDRYEATLAYFYAGLAMEAPWLWRSYKDVGHELTPQVIQMAQAFLAHWVSEEKTENLVGDYQSYQVYTTWSQEAGRVPKDTRVFLPSGTVAKVWKQE